MHRILPLMLALAMLAGGCRQQEDHTLIRIWHSKDSSERDFLNEVVARYNAANPGVRVVTLYKETEELRNHFIFSSIGGQGPDLVYGPADNLGTFGLTETVRPLDDLLPPEYFADFTEDGLLQWEGRTVMVADQVGNHLAFVYNRKLMPVPPATLDELVEMGQRLTIDINGNGRPDQYALAWNYTEPFFFIPFLTAFGGWVMDEDGRPTLDTEATVKAIQFVLDLRDRYRIIPRESDYNVAETLFKEGRSAAIINGSWAWAGYGAAGVDYGLARIPMNSANGQWSAPMMSAKGYSLNPAVSDERLPQVLHLLQYLTSAEIQMEMAERLTTIPVLRSVLASDVLERNPHLAQSLAQVEVARQMPLAPQMRQIWDGMRGPYQLVMNGAITAERGAAMMQREAQKRIDDTFL
jgi:maltose-binding protein MalE